jgi:membrane-bound lytic murein transglycosylase D
MVLKRRLRTLAIALALGLAPGIAAAAAEPSPAPTAAAPIAPALPDPFDLPGDLPMPDPDLWQRIRVGFLMEALDSPQVHEQELWYSSRPDYINRFVDRGSRYLHYIVEQVEKRKMPTEIALLPVIESAFTPKAYSRAKASGLWQFIPSTGKNYGLTQDWWRDNRNDVMAATDAALNYLQKLYNDFGSWELALAAYNCGEGCVGRAIAWNQKRGLPTDYLSLTKLPPETRTYVPKLIAVKNIVLSPATYGIEIETIPNTPYFTTVQAPAKIDVKVAANLAGMSEDDFGVEPRAQQARRAEHRTGICRRGPRRILPVNLEAYDKPLVSWTTIPRRKGESLDSIAKLRPGGIAAEIGQRGPEARQEGPARAVASVMVPMKRRGGAGARCAGLGGRARAHVGRRRCGRRSGEALRRSSTPCAPGTRSMASRSATARPWTRS